MLAFLTERRLYVEQMQTVSGVALIANRCNVLKAVRGCPERAGGRRVAPSETY